MSSDEEVEEAEFKGVPGCIVLINLFNLQTNGTAQKALEANCLLLKQYLRESSNYIGICVYGIDEPSSTILDMKYTANILPLTKLTVDDYRKVQQTNLQSFTLAKDLILSEVLWHSSKMFAYFKRNLLSRTVILMTRLDIPPVETDKKPTLKRVIDLIDSGIEIKIINISENNYVVHPFYEKLLLVVNNGNDYVIPKPIWNTQEICKLMFEECHKNFALARLNFEIGSDFVLSVRVYSLLETQGYNPLKEVDLDRETNAVLSRVTTTKKVVLDFNSDAMDEDDNESKELPLLKSEILYYQEFGGERIEFTDAEMKTLKNPFGPPILKLLGFKPLNLLCKEKWFLKKGYFLIPNESKINGSTVAFKALHQACFELNMAAICVLTTRVNSKPKIVALCPSSQPLEVDIDAGFDVVQMPFVENVRDIVHEEVEEGIITDIQKSAMEKIIKEVMFECTATTFENPKVQSKMRAIEAIALEEDKIEPFVDTTKPRIENFENLDASNFCKLFGSFSLSSQKRTKSITEQSYKNKRLKVNNIDHRELKQRIDSQTVSDYNVDQLKQILKSLNNPEIPALTGVKKNQLVALVYQFYA